ncbi:uncharacterized protein LOC128875066 [Hylaeus volcanicus]|uniref:uncharacterized protein LOC128875066 n=1 Tax=Hylaeus volcanicus TaxID=313075 RepID=UPI0023B7798E|nr:uncharacterized protein LOC128875066 [Hylaeus volcanicus]
MDIKDGMQKLAEAVDALGHGLVERQRVLHMLQALGTLTAPPGGNTPAPRTRPDRKRDRAVVSSPEEEAARAKKKPAVDQEKWSTAVGRKKRADKPSDPPLPRPKPRRGEKAPKNSATPKEQRAVDERRKKKRRRRRRRPKTRRTAVLLKPAEGATYASIVGAIRRLVRPEEADTEVRQIRRTREGAVLLELGRCGDSARFQSALRTAVGDTAAVRGLKPRATIEILDLDCVTTSGEVMDAVARVTGESPEEIRVSVLATNHRELRKAVVELGEGAAVKLLAAAKLKIGWVNCRIRRWTEVQRCFRCLGYGHTRRECKGPDRSNACRRRGKDGHKAAACEATPHCHLCAGIKDATTDHYAGSGKCRIFREILAAKKGKPSSRPRSLWRSELRSSSQVSSTAIGTTWFRDDLGTAAVWITDPRRVRIDSHGAAAGHVWVTSGVLTYVSCYLSPNDSISEFRGKLDVLEDTLRDKSGGLVVAGDFNARACEWGMPRTDTRGRLVVEMASRLGLVVLNVGSTPTYRRPGFGDSIPDVTLVSEDLVQRAANWRVIGDFTGSDHSYITPQLIGERQARPPGIRRPRGYVTSRLDEDRLYATLRAGVEAVPQTPRDPSDRAGAEAIVRGTLNLIRRACDESMPRRRPFSGRRQAYWWTDQIASLRREALRLRRRAQRARSRPEAAALRRTTRRPRKP